MRQMWQAQDILPEIYVEFLCFGGRKICIQVLSAVNKHIYHITLTNNLEHFSCNLYYFFAL